MWASSQARSCLPLLGSWHHIVTEIESREGGWGGVTLPAHSLLAKEMPVCSAPTMLGRLPVGLVFQNILPLPRMALGVSLSSLPPFPSLHSPPPQLPTPHTDGGSESKVGSWGSSLRSWGLLPPPSSPMASPAVVWPSVREQGWGVGRQLTNLSALFLCPHLASCP